MPGLQVRSASHVSAPSLPTPVRRRPGHRSRRPGWAKSAGRLRRRYQIGREVTFCVAPIPDGPDSSGHCLLFVHVRKIVGLLPYRVCLACAQAVITDIANDEHLRTASLATRTLAHLRFRHPGMAWSSTLDLTATCGLTRGVRLPVTSAEAACRHAHARAVKAATEAA
ncbi:hypothetical protein J7E97_20030 [Streptomyces sp. ISL-66]|uniref:hypothetical protein n=1 Tax=Streptomyces sp. ISL-66 TaxID=2819186 RepID=UPI001BEAD62A|nr:hypothetical protein [Streptomyces sp. ISL-66]MBT2470102.1 hypothetical protein [Streptomyces sp. ISL-66]